MSELSRLGQVVRDAQEEQLARRDEDLRAVRARLLQAPPRRRGHIAWAGLGAAAALAAAVALFVGWPRPTETTPPTPAVTYEVDGEAAAVGDWLSTDAEESMAVRFSDGSELDLSESTDARVASTEPHGARVELSRGQASVHVVHREQTRWRLDAGPFDVHVVGTRFDLRWDPEAARFRLDLHRGRVRVSGPVVGERELAAGDHLEVWLRERRVEQRGETQASAQVEREPAEVVVAEVEEAPTPTPAPTSTRRAAPPEEPTGLAAVVALADEARYADAVGAAERHGWRATLDGLDAVGLAQLADAARFARRPERAVEAYQAIRRRFGGPAGARAAFELGRLAHDRRGRPADAARWFETYLREAPSGRLAQEAAGRLVETRRDAGDPVRAREAARRYLTQWPSGPYAPLARSLVER